VRESPNQWEIASAKRYYGAGTRHADGTLSVFGYHLDPKQVALRADEILVVCWFTEPREATEDEKGMRR